jgi:PKD repeat protein
MNDTLFHVLINSETNNSFFDSNGVLLTVPVTIPAGWNPGETHPVTIRNVILGTHSGTIASSARNGTLSATEGVDPNVYAGFYSTKFLNRVLFTNLSSETATGFLWDFGDGNTSTEREPLHVYETSGNYDVCLKAYNTFASDSAKLNVSINPENLWNISGILSLNKHKKEVKNYTSPDELFQQLSQATITGDMIINVEAGETFEYALTSASVAILTGIKNQLAAGNYKLVFQKEGDTDNPVINFDGVVNKESITAIIQWGQYIEIEQVDIKISGIKIDITKIYDFTNQEISSGATSVPVDFTAISNAFSYNWTIVSAPEAITGYSPSGTNVIPAMVLTNNSLLEDTVKYKVSIFLMELELYAFEYQIIVLPDLPDLQVTFIEIPNNIIESKTFIIDAIITNTGKNIVEEKSRTDGIWRSEESVFDMQTASLIGTKNTRQALAPNESYTISFELTAPADSMGIYYYFVAADMDNNIRESDETNNRLGSNPVTIYPNMMDETDYLNLVAFYTNFGGASWINRHWDTTSLRIGNKWAGVTFDNGRVTKIELPSNNVTGELSDTLYRFPYLTTLNLYDNRLSGNLSNLFGSDNRPDSLVTLNLGKNQLTGTIPASISNQVYLRTLNLSYNQLTDMEDVLPENIVQPDLQYQSFKADSITLSAQPLLPIPPIAHYNHAGRNFDFNPSWQLYRSSDLLLAYYPEGDLYRWNVLYADEKDFEWKYDSGSEFNLFQTNGLTAGSSMPVKIYFDKGDTNIDNEVDILDVQHSLNYMFNEHQSAFNYTAADTYPDSMITVQDLITTVNIILDTDTNYTAKRSFQPVSEINNKLFIENGQLILYAEQPVAASDITLQGISNNEISPVLDGTKFQYIFRNQAKGTRLIFFSPAGDVIPSGYTVLAELSGKNVRLVNAVLASRDATRLPVSILTTPMNLSPVNTDNLKIRANGNVVHYYLPWNVDNITATLYTIQGEAVSKQTMNRLVAGNHEMNFNITHQGVYILNTTIHLEGQIISKNIKLVVLK